MIHLPDRPSQETTDFESYQDRRQFLSTAGMGIVSASAASLLSTHPASPAESGTIRPFRVNIPEGGNCRSAQARDGRHAGPIGRRSRIHLRAYSSRRCGNSRAIGRRNTTGARSRRN